MPGKGPRSKKRKRDEQDSPDLEGSENPSFEDSMVSPAPEQSMSEPGTPPLPPPRKKKKSAEAGTEAEDEKKDEDETVEQEQEQEPAETIDGTHHRFNKAKLKELLSAAEVKTTSQEKGKKSFMEKAKDKLTASRFRYLNEQLYTQTSSQSAKMFKEDTSLFAAYHQGFQLQANAWPNDPLDTIISACLHLPDDHVVVDMGCGEARLARSISNKVHSFDLVAMVPGVVECDMSKVPLKSATVQVVVFCLSLMGTNIKDFLLESTRILEVGGLLKIAELESRFQGQEQLFIREVEKYGFQLSWKNLKNQYFYFFDFKKVGEPKPKKKLQNIQLKPCLYKKR